MRGKLKRKQQLILISKSCCDPASQNSLSLSLVTLLACAAAVLSSTAIALQVIYLKKLKKLLN